ncbi:MAG: NAD(+) synthase [Gammaproteobacteria bacterium]|nr:NAD(+) synthase [Gammaproteobacteria bacterium]MYC25514.1 NAD(+) synthase [Gammaproteobacteria bacterium]
MSDFDYRNIGFVRVGAVAPATKLADPFTNAEIHLEHYQELVEAGCAIALFPELSITGYSCEDLFYTHDLRARTIDAICYVASQTNEVVLVFGAPVTFGSTKQILNCAIVCAEGEVVGVVPKIAIPNHGEFYERRWFTSGKDIEWFGQFDGEEFTLDSNQTFSIGRNVKFGIEICEDLWVPDPPSNKLTANGAELILNLSASNELVTKTSYRRDLVRVQSAKCACAYVMASAGPLESSKDTVYGGHLLAFENGDLLDETTRYSELSKQIIVDCDVHRVSFERARSSTFPPPNMDEIMDVRLSPTGPLTDTVRKIDPTPFVPQDDIQLNARLSEIFDIQVLGLSRRVQASGKTNLVVGLSGGVDSTLAFLVCLEALRGLEQTNAELIAVTMPSFGTSDHTLTSVRELTAAAKIKHRELDIRDAVTAHLKLIEHDGARDITFENAQARERTKVLFNLANLHDGIVVGSGNMSELALGWCTFNGDHMSSYNVNVGIPKTLVRCIVRWYSQSFAKTKLRSVLERILNTPSSPELLEPKEGEIAQETEKILGPYEVQDFFLYNYMRNGASMRKLYELAKLAFADRYSPLDLKLYLTIFVDRFFRAQFKRTTLPPGPKVGTISLSPRTDWRMPDEIDPKHLIEEVSQL